MEQCKTRSQRSGRKKENEKDGFVRLILLQTAIASLALAVAVSIKFLEQESFLIFKETFSALISDTDEIKQASVWIKEIEKGLGDFLNEYLPRIQGEISEQEEQPADSVEKQEPEGADFVRFNPSGSISVLSLKSTNKKMPAPKNSILSPVYISSRMSQPVIGPITSAYGYRIHPLSGEIDFHTGVDIAAAANTLIGAAMDGTVCETGENEIFGNYIILSHGNGIKTMYAHCQEIAAKQGVRVRRGETIARVGSTGISTGPHVHFEVRVKEIRINPLWVLEPGCLPIEEYSTL